MHDNFFVGIYKKKKNKKTAFPKTPRFSESVDYITPPGPSDFGPRPIFYTKETMPYRYRRRPARRRRFVRTRRRFAKKFRPRRLSALARVNKKVNTLIKAVEYSRSDSHDDLVTFNNTGLWVPIRHPTQIGIDLDTRTHTNVTNAIEVSSGRNGQDINLLSIAMKLRISNLFNNDAVRVLVFQLDDEVLNMGTATHSLTEVYKVLKYAVWDAHNSQWAYPSHIRMTSGYANEQKTKFKVLYDKTVYGPQTITNIFYQGNTSLGHPAAHSRLAGGAVRNLNIKLKFNAGKKSGLRLTYNDDGPNPNAKAIYMFAMTNAEAHNIGMEMNMVRRYVDLE